MSSVYQIGYLLHRLITYTLLIFQLKSAHKGDNNVKEVYTWMSAKDP